MKAVESGLYEPCTSQKYNTPVIVVKKAYRDGRPPRYRPAYDFRLLNSHTQDEKSYIPSIHWIFEQLRGTGTMIVSDQRMVLKIFPFSNHIVIIPHFQILLVVFV